jgi:molybdate transport system regulatory protein
MKTSARNAIPGVVDRVIPGSVNSEVILNVGGGTEIVAVVTRESVDELGLAPGVTAFALINSSLVILARNAGELRTSARNAITGVVSHVDRGAVNDVVTLDIGGDNTITATVTHESALHLDVEPGDPIVALIKASHVILAVE